MNKTILVASKNKGKINEYQQMLSSVGYQVIGLDDIGYDDEIDEIFDTYKDNAIAKVEALEKVYSGIIIGDDSGFEIAALDFKPGVYSARFMSEYSYKEKNEYIVNELNDADDRSCAFVCAIACLKDNQMWVTINRAFGIVAQQVENGNGFGYDPIFIPLGYDKPFSLLDENIKNTISHRALATKALIQYLENS
jgi:XTP/dITP diphosphohydrolase